MSRKANSSNYTPGFISSYDETRMNGKGESAFEKVPAEVVANIIQYIPDLQDKKNLMMTSRTLRSYVERDFYRKIELTPTILLPRTGTDGYPPIDELMDLICTFLERPDLAELVQTIICQVNKCPTIPEGSYHAAPRSLFHPPANPPVIPEGFVPLHTDEIMHDTEFFSAAAGQLLRDRLSDVFSGDDKWRDLDIAQTVDQFNCQTKLMSLIWLFCKNLQTLQVNCDRLSWHHMFGPLLNHQTFEIAGLQKVRKLSFNDVTITHRAARTLRPETWDVLISVLKLPELRQLQVTEIEMVHRHTFPEGHFAIDSPILQAYSASKVTSVILLDCVVTAAPLGQFLMHCPALKHLSITYPGYYGTQWATDNVLVPWQGVTGALMPVQKTLARFELHCSDIVWEMQAMHTEDIEVFPMAPMVGFTKMEILRVPHRALVGEFATEETNIIPLLPPNLKELVLADDNEPGDRRKRLWRRDNMDARLVSREQWRNLAFVRELLRQKERFHRLRDLKNLCFLGKYPVKPAIEKDLHDWGNKIGVEVRFIQPFKTDLYDDVL